MSRIAVLAALIMTAMPSDVFAMDEISVVMKNSSEPGESGELFVFVGEQLSYELLDLSCDACLVFDTWHSARYSVAKWIHGVQPGNELTFSVAEHSSIRFGHSRYSLVFVEAYDDDLSLVKYQQVPVYPTEDGFASCGPLDRPGDVSKPLNPEGPELRDIVYSPKLVVDDARRLSAFGRNRAYDPRWHHIDGNDVVCRRGIPLEALVAAKVRRHEMLRRALPEFAEAAQ